MSKISMKQEYPVIRIKVTVLALVAAMAVGAASLAGPVKSSASYEIADDSLTAAGAPGLVSAGYWLLYSAGQPVGNADMTSASYRLEGGYVSGIESVLEASKTVTSVSAPTGTGYSGGASDIVPGATVTYRLEFENKGEAARNALIDDPIPANMSYASGTIQVITSGGAAVFNDDDHADGCGFLSATASVNCLIPNIAAGATGAVVFSTYVD